MDGDKSLGFVCFCDVLSAGASGECVRHIGLCLLEELTALRIVALDQSV